VNLGNGAEVEGNAHLIVQFRIKPLYFPVDVNLVLIEFRSPPGETPSGTVSARSPFAHH